MTLISADDPANLVPLAKDLHARLARREELGNHWPALAEEDRPSEVLADRPLRRTLLPGGGWTWLVIHAIGSVGLWQVIGLPWFKVPGQWWHRGFVRLALLLLQGLILITNVTLLRMPRTA
jgi:hypothetical protein